MAHFFRLAFLVVLRLLVLRLLFGFACDGVVREVVRVVDDFVLDPMVAAAMMPTIATAPMPPATIAPVLRPFFSSGGVMISVDGAGVGAPPEGAGAMAVGAGAGEVGAVAVCLGTQLLWYFGVHHAGRGVHGGGASGTI